jgi:predicted metalloprotease with PDZ domain
VLVALALLGPWGIRAAAANPPAAEIRYVVSLAHPELHRVHVTIDLPAGAAERDLQLPVWNALYQIRDFSQYVDWVRAKGSTGQPIAVSPLNPSRWRLRDVGGGAQVEYEILADEPGPYGAQLNANHGFFNLAEILMYPLDGRSLRVALGFTDVPPGWRMASALAYGVDGEFAAENYDHLVDAPVEIGKFQESDFDQGGGHYRVVVDADPDDYRMPDIVAMVRRIVTAETTWMNDRPFDSYLFLYHFPHEAVGGGMEHADSTAIEVNALVLATDPHALSEVTAHEFFHLWNVKRIRPQSLEPVDYTEENYSTALWFAEGTTNTAQDYNLVRAGLLDERRYLNKLAGDIEELERRPAHRTQSAEASSLEAWLEKYPAYHAANRSISYYNKGELLGVLLDLQLREASHGAASLRDVFQWMNQNYARAGLCFPDSAGVRRAAEAVGHTDLGGFFQNYVAGTEEIPWDDFFRTVGLHLVRHSSSAPDLGFGASKSPGQPPAVSAVDPAGEADRAGLAVGDAILEINGRVLTSDYRQQLAALAAGETIRLRVRNSRGEREVAWKMGSREEVEFELKDVENLTSEQKARRAAWLSGEDQPPGGAP